MHIAMLGHKRIPSHEGGIEVVVEELSTRMVKQGHQVTCYNRTGHHISGKEFNTEVHRKGGITSRIWNGVTLKCVPTIAIKGLAAVTSSFFACLFAAFGKYDVVHVHAEGPAVFCWIPRLLGKRVILTVHGLDWAREKWKSSFGARYIRFGERIGVRFAHQIIVLNANTREYFQQTYGRATRYIPNGVSRPHILPPNLIRKQFSLEKDSYILFLGRIVPEKGCHYLYEAFCNLNTDKKLVFAGGSSDSEEYMDSLKARAAGNDRVIFTGFVDGAMRDELYSNAYLFVLPSDLEGMPLSLLEAMSYGNCVLTSDIEECLNVVHCNGLRFRKSDVQDLTEKLDYACKNPAVVQSFKDTSTEFICKRHQWDAIVTETLNTYQC